MASQFKKDYEEENIRRSFDYLDIEQKGVLTKGNLVETLQSFRTWPEGLICQIVDEIFENVDFNRNEKIDYR